MSAVWMDEKMVDGMAVTWGLIAAASWAAKMEELMAEKWDA